MNRRRVSFEPGEGIVCLVCGDEMRTLAPHLKVHGLTSAAYRARFPGAEIVGPIFKDIARDLLEDRVERGTWVVPTKAGTCKRGHPLRGANLRLTQRGRTCRQCGRDAMARWRKRNRKVNLAQKREHYTANRDRILAGMREAYHRDPKKKVAMNRESRRRRRAA